MTRLQHAGSNTALFRIEHSSNEAEANLPAFENAAREKAGLPCWVDPKQARDVVPHGFRSTFKDWAAEKTNFPDWVSEKAIAHLVGDETRRAYQRGDLFDKRRELMEAWSRYCGVPDAKRAADKAVAKQMPIT